MAAEETQGKCCTALQETEHKGKKILPHIIETFMNPKIVKRQKSFVALRRQLA